MLVLVAARVLVAELGPLVVAATEPVPEPEPEPEPELEPEPEPVRVLVVELIWMPHLHSHVHLFGKSAFHYSHGHHRGDYERVVFQPHPLELLR